MTLPENAFYQFRFYCRRIFHKINSPFNRWKLDFSFNNRQDRSPDHLSVPIFQNLGKYFLKLICHYWLNAVRLKLPPLREREGDIPLLVQHFLKKFEYHGEMSTEAIASLVAYPWKGNVRELENVIERAALLARGEKVQLHHLPEEFQNAVPTGQQVKTLEEVERQHIIKILRTAKDLDDAASALGIDPATLWRKRKKYGLE